MAGQKWKATVSSAVTGVVQKPPEKNVYDLKLHEVMHVGDLTIYRVPGGWLYKIMEFNSIQYDRDCGPQNLQEASIVFVPHGDLAKEEQLTNLIKN